MNFNSYSYKCLLFYLILLGMQISCHEISNKTSKDQPFTIIKPKIVASETDTIVNNKFANDPFNLGRKNEIAYEKLKNKSEIKVDYYTISNRHHPEEKDSLAIFSQIEGKSDSYIVFIKTSSNIILDFFYFHDNTFDLMDAIKVNTNIEKLSNIFNKEIKGDKNIIVKNNEFTTPGHFLKIKNSKLVSIFGQNRMSGHSSFHDLREKEKFKIKEDN